MKSFCRIVGELVNKPYELGKVDCFRSIMEYAESIGVAFPLEFEGQTLESYPDFYREQPQEAKALVVRLFDSLLPEVQPNFSLAGDILLLQFHDKPPFLAINGGNGNIITASIEYGFKVYLGNRFKRLKGWSCQQQFR